jgi:hypothetical protein
MKKYAFNSPFNRKQNIVMALSFFIILAFILTSCQKEQQHPQTDQTLSSSSSSANASAATLSVTGGGQGTFYADLDGDGDIDGSHFGISVSIGADNFAKGHFNCLMAGNADILGLAIMSVEGKVSNGWGDTNSATFSGAGTVNLGKGTMFKDVPFSVTVTPGGPGTGTLRLIVIGAFDGVPGDTNVGNDNYDLPTETVATGQIKMQ